MALILSVGAIICILFVHTMAQMRFEHLNEQLRESEQRNDLKIVAGTAEAISIANTSRRETALAREDTIAIREAIAAKGIIINQH